MRRFVLAILFFLSFVTTAEAQTQSTAGYVAAMLEPTNVEPVPDDPKNVHGWFNATIQCESNYTPRPVVVEVNQRSLETDEGEELWTIDPPSVQLELSGVGGNRYQVTKEVDFVVGATELARGRTGTIEFLLIRTGTGFPSTDCTMFGTRWQFEESPQIGVSTPAPPDETGNSSVPNNVAPPTFSPEDVVVEQGPVRGESHVPNEAFVSMGGVLALFSSYGVYEWRRSRKD